MGQVGARGVGSGEGERAADLGGVEGAEEEELSGHLGEARLDLVRLGVHDALGRGQVLWRQRLASHGDTPGRPVALSNIVRGKLGQLVQCALGFGLARSCRGRRCVGAIGLVRCGGREGETRRGCARRTAARNVALGNNDGRRTDRKGQHGQVVREPHDHVRTRAVCL
jgi:hypothetical protein